MARITIMIVRVLALINLVLGIIFWTGNYPISPMIHMLIGILVVLGVWILSGMVARHNFVLAIAGFILGLVALVYGSMQQQLFGAAAGNMVGIQLIKVGHLVLIVAILGIAESAQARIKRATKI